MLTKKIAVLLSFFCLVGPAVFSQNTSSTYSSIGLGDLVAPGYISNAAMGGIGVASPHIWSLNSVNPALLTYNSFSVFEFGVSGENRSLSTAQKSASIGIGSLEYVALGIPIAFSDSLGNRWTMALSLKPYSAVNYNLVSAGALVGEADSVVLAQSGEGGMNSVSIDNGVKLAKGFSLGLKSTYLFGPTVHESSNILYFDEIVSRLDEDDEIVNDTILIPDYSIVFSQRENVSGFIFEFGALYSFRVNKKKSLNIGLTYFPTQKVKGKQFEKLERKDILGNAISENADTLAFADAGITMPSKLGMGLSYSKAGTWTLGADLIFQQWENYRNFNDNNSGLQNSMQFKIGAEIIPDNTSVDSYLKRTTYRLGFDMGQTPYVIDDTRINEFGINFGLSLPLSSASRVNVAFKYGQRGTRTNGLVREEFFKLSIGASFNGGRWKRLPRFN